MARLAAVVYVQDPVTREELILLPGESPDSEIAALITNPAAWETSPQAAEQAGAASDAEPPPADDTADAASPRLAKKTGPRRARLSTE